MKKKLALIFKLLTLYNFNYSHSFLIIPSRISTGPVADIIFKGCPENKENNAPQSAPAKIHSIVAFNKCLRMF